MGLLLVHNRETIQQRIVYKLFLLVVGVEMNHPEYSVGVLDLSKIWRHIYVGNIEERLVVYAVNVLMPLERS